MKKIKFIALISIFICLLILIPTGFAVDNQSDNETLTTDYYFDANIDNDTGNGTIDNPYKNLTASRVQTNSVIHLKDGVYEFNASKAIYNVTIIGQSSENTILKNAKFTVYTSFTLYNLTLLSSTITNNKNLTATSTIFANTSSSNGGVINSAGTVILDNCSFINNSATFGGAIYLKDSSLYISNSEFANNSATMFGGAIVSLSSTVSVNNSTFRNNYAKYYGGAIYSLYGSFNLTNSEFYSNSAGEGGAAFIDNNTYCYISSNEFLENNAGNVNGLYSLANTVINSLADDNTFSDVENDLLELSTPNLFISDGNYTLIYYGETYSGDLPNSYDLRNLSQVTPVKNQASSGSCWAFTTTAALESCILKAFNITYDFSENNMKNLMALYSDYGWAMTPNQGGYDDMGIGYILSWLGPVNESDDSYIASSILSPVVNSIYHIQNMVFLVRNNYTDNDAIKYALMNYGAVATSIYWDSSYANGASYYYTGSNGANHAVTIVGWDDNYSASNFKTSPAGDGAWIIKNSWGTGSGDKGYYYVSYYDKKCAQPGRTDITYTFILNDTIKYDKNYQYDIPGRTDYFVNSSSTVWYKNRFTSTDDEYLAAVSTYFQAITNYTFYIYVNDELQYTQSGISDRGYYTLNLNRLISLVKGDIFEVAFKITVDGEAGFPISEIVSLNKLLYSQNTSFLSYDGENWTDLFNLTWAYSTHTYKSQVACIKAFTVYDTLNTTISLSVNVTDTFNIKAIVLNQYGRPVTGGNVTFTLNGEEYTVSVVNGIALLNLFENPGQYNISAVYTNEGYISSENNLTFDIFSIGTNITLSISGEHNPVNITAYVLNEYGYAVNTGNVTFTIDGINQTVNVTDGYAIITQIFKTFTKHNVSAIFNPVYYYNSSDVSCEFNVSLISTNLILTAGEYNPVNITVNVLDQYENPVDYGNITFTLDNVDYIVNVTNGTANLNYTFKIGLNTIYAIYNGLYYYDSSDITFNLTVNSTIISQDATKTYNSQYTFQLLDNYANPLNNTEISVIIKSTTYKLTTDENGIAVLNIVLAPASYTIQIINPLNGEVKTQTITVVKRISENKAVTMYYGAGKYYKVKVLDDDGNIAKGVKVTFTVNNKKYTRTTDSKGYASFKISLKPAKYTITAEYKGFKVSNKIKVKSTIITKNIKVKKGKTIKFKAKLVNKNGKILKNKKIKFKFKGKTYKVKTNKKGKAVLKITKKYKSGKYTITSKYGKLKIKNTIKIKK